MKKAFSSYLMALVFVAMPGLSLSQGSAGIARLGDQLTLNLPLPVSKNTDEAYIPIFPHSPSPYSTLTELTADEVNFPSVFMPIVSEFSNIKLSLVSRVGNY